MAEKIMRVRGLIYGLYDSESALARHLGWPRQKLNKITNGSRLPNIEELDELSRALNYPAGELMKIFLPS